MVRGLLFLAPVLAFVEERGGFGLRRSARGRQPRNVAQAIAGIGLDWDMSRIGDKTILNTTLDTENITFDNGETAHMADWDSDNSSSNQPTAADIAAADAAAAAAHQRKLRNASTTKSASAEERVQIKAAPALASSPELKIHDGHEVHGNIAAHALAGPSGLITPHAMESMSVQGMVLPVAAVIIVEPSNSTGTRLRARRHPVAQYSLSEACRKNMNELTSNATKAEKAKLCEKKANFTATALAALKAGDSHGAVHGVEAAFVHCSHMEPQCAREIATQVVQKLRVSGLALDKKCRVVQEQVGNNELSDDDMQCMENTAGHVITALKASNSSDMGFELAIRYAQEGLHNCQKVQAPCDFQIAPFAVKDIVQNFLEEDQARVTASLAQFFTAGEDVASRLTAKGSLLQAVNVASEF